MAANGRTSITIGGSVLVAYLESLNQAIVFDFDINALFGFAEPQAAGSFNNGTLKGTYAGYATNPTAFGVTVFSGEFTADGASPTGNIAGTEDIGAASGPVSGAPFKATYSVSPSPTNGRGTMAVTSGTGGTIIYMISASKFVAVSAERSQCRGSGIRPIFCSSCVRYSFLGFGESGECHGREFLYGHGDIERASSHGRRDSGALQHQRVSGQRTSQRDGCGRSYERNVYGQHQRRRCLDHRHHFRNLRWGDEIGVAHCNASASTGSDTLLADAEPDECHGREFIYRHGDVERSRSIRRSSGDALEQPRRRPGFRPA